jgi:hypothetical protein
LTGLDAETRAGLDRGQRCFGDGRAEDGGDGSSDGSFDHGTTRSTTTYQFGQVIEAAIIHADLLLGSPRRYALVSYEQYRIRTRVLTAHSSASSE